MHIAFELNFPHEELAEVRGVGLRLELQLEFYTFLAYIRLPVLGELALKLVCACVFEFSGGCEVENGTIVLIAIEA